MQQIKKILQKGSLLSVIMGVISFVGGWLIWGGILHSFNRPLWFIKLLENGLYFLFFIFLSFFGLILGITSLKFEKKIIKKIIAIMGVITCMIVFFTLLIYYLAVIGVIITTQ